MGGWVRVSGRHCLVNRGGSRQKRNCLVLTVWLCSDEVKIPALSQSCLEGLGPLYLLPVIATSCYSYICTIIATLAGKLVPL